MACQNTLQDTGCSPEKERALPASISSLNLSVNNLESALSSLQSQLSQLLDPPSLKGSDAGGIPSSASPSHSSEISDLASRIRSATELINEIRERLHV